MNNFTSYKIGPQNLLTNIRKVDFSGQTVGVYSGMTQLLSSGLNGSSLLTGLTLTILLTQTAVDSGYYSEFDGAVLQKDVTCNFIFSSTTSNPYRYYVFNTSDNYLKFLEVSDYYVDWGDGSPKEIINERSPNYLTHDYPITNEDYTITLTQSNPWGSAIVTKKITTPFVYYQDPNPNGVAYFIPKGGNWANTPISYDYIFSGDSVNIVSAQTTNNFITIPYILSGECFSRISELKLYGEQPITYPLFNSSYQIGVPVIANGMIWGVINDSQPGVVTGYTIQNVDYYDYSNGKTIFFLKNSGFTDNNLTAKPITKDDTFLKVSFEPKIQTTVFVERGSNSALEIFQRLGEIDTLGEMTTYGYNFFKIENKS